VLLWGVFGFLLFENLMHGYGEIGPIRADLGARHPTIGARHPKIDRLWGALVPGTGVFAPIWVPGTLCRVPGTVMDSVSGASREWRWGKKC